MSPGVLGGDAGEMQLVSPLLSLTHPTGYPLLVMVNHLWALIVPVGSVAWRLNALNALFAAGCCASLCVISRLLIRDTLAGIVGACFLGFSPLFWSQAIGSDKYTLNALFLALTIGAAVYWKLSPSPRRLGALALILGVSLTNHRSMLLTIPGVALYVLASGWRPAHWRDILIPVLLLVIPLSMYAYVPWAGSRGLPPGTWPVNTAGELIEYFLDRGYTSQIYVDDGSTGRALELARVFWAQIGLVGVVAGLVGVVLMMRRQPLELGLLVLVTVPQIMVAVNYRLSSNYLVPRHWVFYIPLFVTWTVCIAAGIAGFRTAIASRVVRWARVAQFVAVAGVVGAASPIWLNSLVTQLRAQRSAETLDGYRQDLQRGVLAQRFADLSLSAAAPGSVIVADWEQVTALWYRQRVEGLRPDVDIRYPIEKLDAALASRASNQSVYVTRTLPGIERFGPTASVGPLIAIQGDPVRDVPQGAVPVQAEMGSVAELVGVTYLSSDVRAGSVLPLMLYWRSLGNVREDFAVSIRLVDQNGSDVAQSDQPHPVLGTSPTSHWSALDIIGDYHELGVSNRAPAGQYFVQALLYRPGNGVPLAVMGRDANTRGDRAVLPAVQVR